MARNARDTCKHRPRSLSCDGLGSQTQTAMARFGLALSAYMPPEQCRNASSQLRALAQVDHLSAR